MTRPLARLLMGMAVAAMAVDRRDWSDAMTAEYDAAAADGRALPFAAGCLVAAWRNLFTSPAGRYVVTGYTVVLGIMLPMAALQIGCALFGLPYLYPDQRGLAGALLVGGGHEALLRSLYLAALPALALIQMVAGVGHLRLAWCVVEQDWADALRWSLWTMAGVTALVIVMGVLFLDGRQAIAQAVVVASELAMLHVIARRDAAARVPAGSEHPG